MAAAAVKEAAAAVKAAAAAVAAAAAAAVAAWLHAYSSDVSTIHPFLKTSLGNADTEPLTSLL